MSYARYLTSEEIERMFRKWFRDIYQRDYLDIKNDRQDDESVNAHLAYCAGAFEGMMAAAREGGDRDEH